MTYSVKRECIPQKQPNALTHGAYKKNTSTISFILMAFWTVWVKQREEEEYLF